MQDAKQLGNKTDESQVVTAVGNSWIVCKSKTYGGKTYYFNTLTGVARWNLSDIEVEWAQKRTQCLNKQSAGSLKECPEPTEPPTDNVEQRSHQVTYNKKVINNRFSNESFPLTALVAPQRNYVVPPRSSGNQIGLNLPSQNSNAEVWNVPPTHQILITPTGTPIVSKSQIPVNNHQYSDHQHTSVQNTSVSLTSRFKNNSSNFNNSRHIPTNYCNRGYKFRPKNKFHTEKFQRNSSDKPNDLREYISFKRKQRQSIEDNRDIQINNTINVSNQDIEPVQESKIEDSYLSETESSWLEDNVKVDGKKLTLDITCLRNLASPDADPDSWYIAADRTVLLNHLNFLNMLISSDDDCQLLVPREELQALREMADSAELKARTPRLSNRARRALNFVREQFDSLCAVQGEELETNSTSSHILNCCLNVAEENYHVILLSNDTELLNQKDSTNISMFSMNELKAFLTKSKESGTKAVTTPVPAESTIRITIPNNFVKDTIINKTFESISVNTEKLPQQDVIKAPENNIEVKTTLNSLPANKMTIDTGVQTDFVTPTVEVKRREIKLNRNISKQTINQPCSDQNTKTNQFRWRSKRNACSTTNDTSNKTNSSTMNNSGSTPEDVERMSDKDSGHQANQLSTESENIEGSDTSSSICMQKNIHERITIEETSTSGIISNTTASNHDAESVTNEFPDQLSTRFNCNRDKQEDRLKNNYMFEIKSPQTEECLRMRSDEWISRFVQIMEEVLSQVLQQKKPTSFHLTPPPWTLQEALQCILRSSDYYGDVKDAAKKLSNILFNISDETGKINMELRPADFMEMYSYGVYLVDALQGIAKDCEDLQTASDSLTKLMKDIQEPNLDTSNNDAFGEKNHGVSLNVPMNTDEPDNSMNVDNTVSEDPNTHYNLQSKRTSPLQGKKSAITNKVKFVRKIDIEANFFKSLNLQKRMYQEIGESSQGREKCSKEFNFEGPSDLKIETNASNFDNSDNLVARLVNTNSNKVKTRFIRRFSKTLEFEERLSQREPLDLDQLDYDDSYQCREDKCYDDEVEDEFNDKELADNNAKNNNEYAEERYRTKSPDINGRNNKRKLVEDKFDDKEFADNNAKNNEYAEERYRTKSPDINGNTVMCGIIQTFIKEIKDTFTQVQAFCKNTDQELRGNVKSAGRRRTIHHKAETVYISVENIIKSLNSIVNRDSYQHENSLHSLLKKAGIEGFDNKLFNHYRATIVNCLDQANILLEVVDIIMSATKCDK